MYFFLNETHIIPLNKKYYIYCKNINFYKKTRGGIEPPLFDLQSKTLPLCYLVKRKIIQYKYLIKRIL